MFALTLLLASVCSVVSEYYACSVILQSGIGADGRRQTLLLSSTKTREAVVPFVVTQFQTIGCGNDNGYAAHVWNNPSYDSLDGYGYLTLKGDVAVLSEAQYPLSKIKSVAIIPRNAMHIHTLCIDELISRLAKQGFSELELAGIESSREAAVEMVVFPMTTGDADKWAWVNIGEPFPENPVRVPNEMNQYVALWYKNGKPLMGRAWNNGGVVECSFPYSGRELTGARDLGGQIQILTYKGTIDDNKFEYKWVAWKERGGATFALVRCGQATQMLLKVKSGNSLVGNLDLSSEVATVAENGKEEKFTGGALAGNLIIVREHFKPDPPSKKEPRIIHPQPDQWKDIRIHDATPCTTNLIMAGGKKINYGDGKLVEHFVSLWYKNGEPVFGRCWGYKGEMIEASFGILGKEFTGAIGSIQVLTYTTPEQLVFEYKWVPYKECVGGAREWKPLQVKDAAPCVIKDNKGNEKLGCCWMNKGKASLGFGGLEETYVGGCVDSFLILCRKDLPPRTVYE